MSWCQSQDQGPKTENRNLAIAEGLYRGSKARQFSQDKSQKTRKQPGVYLCLVVLCIQPLVQRSVERYFTKDLQFSYIS